MSNWILLDTAPIPGGGTLRLQQRDADFSITLGYNELMNSRLKGSEEALAVLACARIEGRARPRILIGGLGMGFTLRAAQAALPADAEIVVAELLPEVVAWARGPLASIFGTCLDDPRVAIRVADVAKVIREGRGAYDAVLLDVDNGPDGLMAAANDKLYDYTGIGTAKAALKPGGVLAIWSAAPDQAFAKRLQMSGFEVKEAKVRANAGGGGARHVIWLCTEERQGRGDARDGGRSRPGERGRRR